MSKDKKRLDYIDLYKGVGIILMIMGHIYYGNEFDFFIHAFHMPMFFIISGFLFNNKSLEFIDFVKKKVKQLLVPYVVFGLISLGIYYLLNMNDLSLFSSKIYAVFFINTDNMPITGALWFLSALFFAEVIYYCINLIKTKETKIIIIIVCTFLGIFIPKFMRLPYAIDISLSAVGFMYAGSIIKKYKERILNTNILWISLFTIIDIALIYTNGYVNIRLGEYSIILLTFVNSIMSSIILLYYSYHICNYSLGKDGLMNNIKDLFISIGCNSITYLVLNEIIIYFLSIIIGSYYSLLLVKFLCLPIVVFVLFYINKFISKKYLKFCIGK